MPASRRTSISICWSGFGARGYGRLLIERLLDELRHRGSPGVHLDVAIDNANAIAFYRHLGFDEVERRDDALLMGLPLGP